MADKKLFNPDIEVRGVDCEIEQQLSQKVVLYYDGTPCDALDCPYDGTYCRQKAARFLEWRTAVKRSAKHGINRTFKTERDMFHGCPLSEVKDCVRRLRYEKIIENSKQR